MALVATTQDTLGNLNLQDGNNYLNNLANKYVVKPKTADGIGGFVFDYEGESTVNYQAEITDHYLETNDPVQDHIAQRPVKIVLRGFISELAQRQPRGISGALQTIQNKLTAVPAYIGRYTPGAIQGIQKAITTAQDTVNKINLGLAKVQNVVGFFPGATPQDSKQQVAFAKLVGMYETRQIFTVQTPYTYFKSMVIESLTFVQPEDTVSWSDISVTLKQLRFVEVKTVALSRDILAGRAAFQRQSQVAQGNTQGTTKPVSLLRQGVLGLGGA